MLIVSSFILTCLVGVYDYFYLDPITEQVIDYASNLEPDYIEGNEVILFVLIGSALVLAIASFVGILLFKSWARHFYIASFILLLPLYPYMGITVYSGWGQALYDINMLLSGAILVLMYYSPVAKYFDSNI